MSVHHVVPAADRATFLECRRAWDLSARERRNLEPARPATPLDVEQAVRAALAVYYFPGMWDWPPAVVAPLVRKAFTDSVAAQQAAYLAAHGITGLPADQARATAQQAELGLAVVESYAGWAPTVDEFAPLQVLAELEVQVPDRRAPGRELAVGGRAVRYRDRADLIAMDSEHGYWLVEHRFVLGAWPDVDALVRDDRCLSWCWAWEHDNPGLRVRGTIHNELRLDPPGIAKPPPGPRGTVAQNRTTGQWLPTTSEYDLRVRFGEGFRRVQVPRQAAEVAACGTRLADQVAEMIDPAIRVYASPSVARCAPCSFRAPCLALDASAGNADNTGGGEAEALLAAGFRARDHEPRPGTLGARTWSVGRGAAPPPA